MPKVSVPCFIMTAELLDLAFAGPDPMPDYWAHECELAQQALDGLLAKAGSTRDTHLAEVFALTHRQE